MKYNLIKLNKEYCLVLTTGEMKTLTIEQTREFILNFETFEITQDANSLHCQCDGELLASLNDKKELTIYSSAFLGDIFFNESAYVSIQEYADMHEKKRAIISRLCNDGRLPGAVRKGTKWYIPKNAPYPKDCRAGRDMSKRYAYKKQINQTNNEKDAQ